MFPVQGAISPYTSPSLPSSNIYGFDSEVFQNLVVETEARCDAFESPAPCDQPIQPRTQSSYFNLAGTSAASSPSPSLTSSTVDKFYRQDAAFTPSLVDFQRNELLSCDACLFAMNTVTVQTSLNWIGQSGVLAEQALLNSTPFDCIDPRHLVWYLSYFVQICWTTLFVEFYLDMYSTPSKFPTYKFYFLWPVIMTCKDLVSMRCWIGLTVTFRCQIFRWRCHSFYSVIPFFGGSEYPYQLRLPALAKRLILSCLSFFPGLSYCPSSKKRESSNRLLQRTFGKRKKKLKEIWVVEVL